jgi:hypothetical protein
LLEFLFHEGLELEGWGLEQLQRLLQLRRQHLLELHLLRQIETLRHAA